MFCIRIILLALVYINRQMTGVWNGFGQTTCATHRCTWTREKNPPYPIPVMQGVPCVRIKPRAQKIALFQVSVCGILQQLTSQSTQCTARINACFWQCVYTFALFLRWASLCVLHAASFQLSLCMPSLQGKRESPATKNSPSSKRNKNTHGRRNWYKNPPPRMTKRWRRCLACTFSMCWSYRSWLSASMTAWFYGRIRSLLTKESGVFCCQSCAKRG